MAGVKAFVTVGVGERMASTSAILIACPHVGDFIRIGQRVVECRRVEIDEKCVFVHEPHSFWSEDEAKKYFDIEIAKP